VTGSLRKYADRFSWGERMSGVGESGQGRCELAHSGARALIVGLILS